MGSLPTEHRRSPLLSIMPSRSIHIIAPFLNWESLGLCFHRDPEYSPRSCVSWRKYCVVRKSGKHCPPYSPWFASATLAPCSLWMCQAHSCLNGFAWLKLPGSTSPRKPPNLLQLLQCFEPPLGEVFQIILASGPTPHSSLFFIMIFTTSNTL